MQLPTRDCVRQLALAALLTFAVFLVAVPVAQARLPMWEGRLHAKKAIKNHAKDNAAEEDGEYLGSGVKTCWRVSSATVRCSGWAEFYDPYHEEDLRCRYLARVRETSSRGVSTFTEQNGCRVL
jgi:hypothetical protein